MQQQYSISILVVDQHEGIFWSLRCIANRDGLVGPVSRNREHFNEIMEGRIQIFEEIISLYPQFLCISRP